MRKERFIKKIRNKCKWEIEGGMKEYDLQNNTPRISRKGIHDLISHVQNNNVLAGLLLFSFFSFLLISSCSPTHESVNDQFSFAKQRTEDLRLSIYITAHALEDLFQDEAGRREALSIFRCNGITKAYLEVYRGGLVVNEKLLTEVRDFFKKNEIDVIGGIATVPGRDFGVKQEGQLGWFNWQHPKTQNDLKEVIRMSAKVFDEFVVDDFLCTGDTSLISKEAKGDRSWAQYRMDLLTELSEEVFLKPAKEVNPDITMIIKYPQWYDRFHLFGYDVEREPSLFDKVWIGTESRGQYTQRFGFVQPFEGFVSYRWLDDISGPKMSGAWFDHGDCDKDDFIEQAWQTVLAGAKEIVFFNYYSFVNGHPGHHLVRKQFGELADLAAYVEENPVKGIAAYKPPSSDAGGDLYLMDFIGMLGVPLVPVHEYPENAKVVMLPTQAATDKNILEKVERSLENGATLLFTAGFLAHAENAEILSDWAGVQYPVIGEPGKAHHIIVGNEQKEIEYGLDYEAHLNLTGSRALLKATTNSKEIPFFIESDKKNGKIYTLNTHTFSQKDFDAVGEVLLCPRPLGMMEMPDEWVNILRNKINGPLNFELYGSTRICIQPLNEHSWVVHNYNREQKEILFEKEGLSKMELENKISGKNLQVSDGKLKLTLEPRSRIWIKQKVKQ